MRVNVHGYSHRWWAMATVGIGVFMATLDASIVDISLPTIMRYSNSSVSTSDWVASQNDNIEP